MQVSLVNDFANDNFLKLNIEKCEIVVFSRSNRQLEIPYCEVDGSVNTSAKCLDYWWVRDLTASKSVNENIRKAWRTSRDFPRRSQSTVNRFDYPNLCHAGSYVWK